VTIPATIPFLDIPWSDALFVLLAGAALGSALLVVTMRDIIRCALALIACFAALAGLYVLLGAPLLAATQVLVYIGAIAILILFAVMITQAKAAPVRLVFQTQALPAAIAAAAFAMLLGLAAIATDWGAVGGQVATGTDALAALIFSDYVLPFEIVGVLLLTAVIGAVYLARRGDTGRRDES
jgi:NADH:ubiquinone oxidoreductase subunit 6 (subunit J)